MSKWFSKIYVRIFRWSSARKTFEMQCVEDHVWSVYSFYILLKKVRYSYKDLNIFQLLSTGFWITKMVRALWQGFLIKFCNCIYTFFVYIHICMCSYLDLDRNRAVSGKRQTKKATEFSDKYFFGDKTCSVRTII